MPYTLSTLLQDIYAELGQFQVSLATGGSASTLLDASLAGKHSDDEWKGGAIFVVGSAGAAPEGEFAALAGFASSSGTFTLAASLGAAIEAGDRYGLASAYYPLETMIELANAGLRALGDIPLVDDQTLVTGDGQSSYVATLEWTRRRPLRIDYLAIPGLSAIDPWRTVHDWDFVPGMPGNPGLILFADALPAGRPLRIWYQAAHPGLRAYDDPVAAALAPELAVAAGAERALHWQNARLGGSDAHLAARWEQAQSELANARRSFPIWRPGRRAKMLTVGSRQ
ncbi:MAG: hypothetical protein WEA61_03660 [Anaerolineales bacterium]